MKKLLLLIIVYYIVTSCKNTKMQRQTLVQLGKQLFFDQQLSYNQTKSCSSCHDPKFAFTDGYKRSIGSQGDLHQRNSKPLFNLQNKKYFTAADSTLHSLVQQMNNPMFNQSPIELGIKNHETEILQRFTNNNNYQKLFANAFANKKINIENIKIAIAAYLFTLKSYNSKYDIYLSIKNNFTEYEKQGMQLFFDSLKCNNCHGGINFNTPIFKNKNGEIDFYFNTGLYNLNGIGSYPIYDIGLMQKTNNPNDMGKFIVPTLRNLSYTTPYYHDGSQSSLLQVINDYNDGGRNILDGENKGEGSKNKFKHHTIKPLKLTELQKQQLLSFLLTLNDSSFVNKN